MELRLIRLLATLGFFAAVTLLMVTFAGVWGFLGGAVLFGGMTAFLWKDEAQIAADERANRRVVKQVPPPADQTQQDSPGSWS